MVCYTSFVSLILLNTRLDGSDPANMTRVPFSTSSAGVGHSSLPLGVEQAHGEQSSVLDLIALTELEQ